MISELVGNENLALNDQLNCEQQQQPLPDQQPTSTQIDQTLPSKLNRISHSIQTNLDHSIASPEKTNSPQLRPAPERDTNRHYNSTCLQRQSCLQSINLTESASIETKSIISPLNSPPADENANSSPAGLSGAPCTLLPGSNETGNAHQWLDSNSAAGNADFDDQLNYDGVVKLNEPNYSMINDLKNCDNENPTTTCASAGLITATNSFESFQSTTKLETITQCMNSNLAATGSSLSAALRRGSIVSRASSRKSLSQIIVRKFQKLDEASLTSTPAPDVKIGQRVAYKEYYGNEFGTIRWIGRVPQICPDWTVGVEFDNAIGEGDGSLNGRRYFIAKDCFAKFLPLNSVALVDQHVGRPEPGTMISVMSAAVRPGQMISIQRVSTVHVQHCFLNAPHRVPGADILAVNTRLHCQCPNCGPCAHIIKPPRTQRLPGASKNATHMCQFSTYTCCGMESQEETMCTYEGNKVSSVPPPPGSSWIDGLGYLTNLQQLQHLQQASEKPRANFSFKDQAPISTFKHSQQQQRTFFGQNSAPFEESPQAARDLDPPEAARPSEPNFQPSSSENPAQLIDAHQLDGPKLIAAHGDKQLEGFEENLALDAGDELGSGSGADEDFGDGKISEGEAPQFGRQIVYRDSIENRYLFPTDDEFLAESNSSNSTLEAELENLSQARYGVQCPHEPQEGPHPSAPANGIGGGAGSGSGGSRKIFKSLRSLVSCLSAQTNTNSNSHGHRGSSSDRNGHGYSFGGRNENFNSSEIEMKLSVGPRTFGASQIHSTSSRKFKRRQEPSFQNGRELSGDNFVIREKTNGNKSAPIQVQEVSALIQAANHHNQCNDSMLQVVELAKKFNNDYKTIDEDDADKLSLDAGSSPNSSNEAFKSSDEHCCRRRNRKQQARQVDAQSANNLCRHYSSSDCGFSSASQNSVSFQQVSASNLNNQQSCLNSPKQILNNQRQVYERILGNLMKSSSLSSEHLLKLRQVLIEPQFAEHCCLHCGNNSFKFADQMPPGSGGSEDIDQLIANLIKSSHLGQNKNENFTSTQMVSNVGSPTGGPNKANCLGKNFNSCDGSHCLCCRRTKGQNSIISSSFQADNSSISAGSSISYDSNKNNRTTTTVELGFDDEAQTGKRFRTKAPPGGEQPTRKPDEESIKIEAKAIDGLPKAFELRLTLSINADGKQANVCEARADQVQPISGQVDLVASLDDNQINCDDQHDSLGNCLNSSDGAQKAGNKSTKLREPS